MNKNTQTDLQTINTLQRVIERQHQQLATLQAQIEMREHDLAHPPHATSKPNYAPIPESERLNLNDFIQQRS